VSGSARNAAFLDQYWIEICKSCMYRDIEAYRSSRTSTPTSKVCDFLHLRALIHGEPFAAFSLHGFMVMVLFRGAI
jgi:hypothetical protein